MIPSKHVTLVLGAAMALFSFACSQPADATGEAPDTLEGVATSDLGTSYNGWTQDANIMVNVCGAGPNYLWHNLSRSYGDATRGGGACLVANYGSACSSDAQCTTSAQAAWGPSVYGYCVQGNCYARPGSQADYCVLNPNRSPGQLNRTVPGSSSYYALGCMTKTAGPNLACGGTDQSLYMRQLNDYVWWDNTGCDWY